MGADYYLDCPICKKNGCVRIDCTFDIEVNEKGLIDCSYVKAYCTECKTEFKH